MNLEQLKQQHDMITKQYYQDKTLTKEEFERLHEENAIKQKAFEPQPTIEELNEQIKSQRASTYRTEADPLFFKSQRGEATIEEWQLKVNEIKERFPYA